MSIRHWFRARFASLRTSNRMRDFQRELESHLDLEAEEQRESGASPDESRYAARRAFGNETVVKEDVRGVWSVMWLEAFLRDLRYGARALRKNPGFSIVAILTLALGIGANTAIFSIVDSLMLRPLLFPNADRIVRLYATKNGLLAGGFGAGAPSALDVRDYERSSTHFEKMVAYDTWRKNVSYGGGAGEPEQMRVGLVPATYFEIIGIQPLLGRSFTREENTRGKNYVAAISEHVWKTRYNGDTAILGRKVRINDEAYTIVAVMPVVIPEWMEPGRPGPVEIWTPSEIAEALPESARGARDGAALGRLKPGVSIDQAQTELSTIAANLAASHPLDQGFGVLIKPIAETRVGRLRPMLLLLMGAVSLILLIACVNLANLLLARNSARQRELALRTALGAGRPGLIRQLLAETLLLSLAGAGLGIAIAKIALASFIGSYSAGLPQLAVMGMDWRVLVFTLAVSTVTSVVFGLVPAMAGTRLNLVDSLKEGGRSGMSGRAGGRMRSLLVVVEMAMSLILLVGASLMVQSILRLQRQGLGIHQDHLLKGHFYLPPPHYPNPDAITRFCDEFGRRVRALPGVVEAAVTTIYPPSNGWTQMIGLQGRPAGRLEDIPTAQFGVTDTHFLSTMGIPLLRGRDFADSDNSSGPPVALISQEFVRRYFSSEDPLGQRIHIGPPEFLQIAPGANISDAADVTIVGIIGDFRNAGLAAPPEPQILVPYSQHPLVNYSFKDVVIRTSVEPKTLAKEVARQLHALDADMPFAEVQTMDELIEQRTGSERLTTTLLSTFAAGGLVLAMVGIYGVVSFLVAQRKQEMAVRLALGAEQSSVLWLVLRRSLGMAIVGAALGLLGAAAAQRLISGVLFGISAMDPATFIGAALVLLTVAILASIIPGARVMFIDPARTLRQE